MLSDITTIKIQGANFTSLTPFKLFDPVEGDKSKTVKATLLYGRNGTGKSTIAKAFRKIKGETLPTIIQASIYNKEGNSISLTETDKKHIFVYDEDFVYKNVRLQEDHLDTIVMLGEAADLTEQIDKAEAERDKALSDYEAQIALYKEYTEYDNPKSPKYYIIRLGNALRGDESWAGRDKRIRDARQNTQVRDDTYKQFVNLTPSKSSSKLLLEFEEKMEALKNARSGASAIDAVVPSFSNSYIEYDDERLQDLLAGKIEKPELTDRERYLLRLVESGNSNDLSSRLIVFKQAATDTCPYCLQSVSKEYKADLVTSIEKVLSKTVEDHQKKLQGRIFEEIRIDLSQYEELNSYKQCVELIEKINTTVLANNERIRSKISNPYEPIYIIETDVAGMAIQLEDALEELEKERKAHNAKATKTEPIEKELIRINGEIAHYDVAELAALYDKQFKESKAAKRKSEEMKIVWEDRQREVENLEAQRRNVKLALGLINACMKYIFFAEDRLRIEYVDGVYKLLSHGKSVKPCDVSVGERNIIGLSYFFTSIMEGQEEKDAYSKEYLLVIDDPVSSYDLENRIGIISFLKYKLAAFLEGNENTRAIVMTHDLTTLYDLLKTIEEIMEVCKTKDYSKPPIFHHFELSENGELETFRYRNRHEYTELVGRIYRYARGETGENELVIGNIMRQVIEAFSTFQYKKDIQHVSTDEQILALLGDPEYVAYYRNLMYRLVLHGGSHREEQVKTMQDFRFFSLISDAEKEKTARDVLCFIYLLNKRHLLVHLKEFKDVETTLNGWCQDIKRNAAVI